MDSFLFWEEYREVFKRNLLSFAEGYLKDKELIEKLTEVIYEAFTKRISKNFFYYLAVDFAKRGENIKTPVLKTMLTALRDFLDYAVKEEMIDSKVTEEIKRLTEAIEEVSQIIDKAYQDYYEKLKEEVKVISKEKSLLLKEAHQITLKGETLTLIFSYKELPIYCKGKSKEISEDVVRISFEGRCLIQPILKVGNFLYAKAEGLSEAVKMEVLSLEEDGFQARLIGYEEVFLEKRQHVRVIPDKSIPIYVSVGGRELVGEILDISVGGVGIFLKNRGVKKGDVAELRFSLKGKEIRAKGECRYTEEWREGIRAGFMFLNLGKREEQIIGEYVMERQREILKELKAFTGG